MSEYKEYPLGVNMHDFEHADRIQELSKAISRYACFFLRGIAEPSVMK